MAILENRNEILFLYDVKDANPNGDPFENKPRLDTETGLNMVTDTRLKRTIRDYLDDFRQKKVFIKVERKDNGELKTREERIEALKITKDNRMSIFKDYIDLRLFGATIAISSEGNYKGWSINKPGPVQFNIGRSLNRVKVETIKGTSVMPSQAGKEQGTFIDTNIVHYSLICFHGITNENAAKETGLSEDDMDLLYDAIWNGTKNLITRSKVGQQPRLLLRVVYSKDYHIGDLHKTVRGRFSTDEMSVRDISEVTLDTSDLVKTLNANKERIKLVQIKKDDRLSMTDDIKSALIGINVQDFNF